MNCKYSRIICFSILAAVFATVFAAATWASYTKEDKAVERIGVEDARQLVESGKALLVCSYGDDSCKSKLLEGAILKSELEARLDKLSKDQAIIFYCG